MTQVHIKERRPEVTSVMSHKLLMPFAMVWVSMLLMTIFTSVKTFELFHFTFVAAAIGYPVTYIFADIFTEVYGYRVSRKVVWTGFFCVLLTTIFAYVYTLIPPSSYFDARSSESFNFIFQVGPVIALASVLAFWSGEFINSFVLAKMKLITRGRHAELRYLASTLCGQTVDNTIGVTTIVLLSNIFAPMEAAQAAVSSIIFCTVWELLASPITKRFIAWVKEVEGIDTYDVGTVFNPFKL